MMLNGVMFAALVAALAFVDAGVDAAVWHVPLQRHTLTTNDADAQASRHRALGDSPYPWGMRLPSVDMSTSKHSSVWARLFPVDHDHDYDHVSAVEHADFHDIGRGTWAAQIAVGSPPQQVSLLLDMGSAEVLMLNHPINKHGFYDHKKSTTYHANGTQIKLYEGTPFEMDGFVSSDLLALSVDGEGPRMSFVELASPDRILSGFMPGCDGSIGLGPHRSQSTGAPSFVRSMINQGLLDAPVVGFRFDAHGAHATGNNYFMSLFY